jgi:hypothetical protein
MQLGEQFNANYYNFLNWRAYTVTSDSNRDTLFNPSNGTAKILTANDKGFLVYNSTTNVYQYYSGSGTAWIDIINNGLANGKIYVGNGSGIATQVTMSGDVTIDNAGVASIGSGVIVNADISGTASIADTKLATISTALKVANSATTATTADTNDAIVLRTSTGYIQTGKTPSVNNDVANKLYVDNQLATLTGAMVFKGTIGASGTITGAAFNALTTYTAGWQYRVNDAATYTIGGGSFICEVGDIFTCVVTRSGGGNTSSDWTVSQANIDGAVIGPASATDNDFVLFNGGTGKSIKDSTFSVVPINKGGTNNASLAVTSNGIIYTDGSKLMNTGAPTASVSNVLTANASVPTFKQNYLKISLGTTTTNATNLTGVMNGFVASGASINDFNCQLFDNNGELVITKIALGTSTNDNPVFNLSNIVSTTTTGWTLIVGRIKF